ncbi:PAS domain-containing protein [Tunturiibacter empetritectus]|uniref:PAS domain-containing protein n=1 Tax=Tunturiibacter empetritectus TaxID=3069691 RepID=UPI003D9B61F5
MKFAPACAAMPDSIAKAPVTLNRRAQFRRESDAENDSLARLVARLPEAILCFDRNWVITYANAEAVRVSHIQPSDINSKTHWQLFPETVGTALERTYRTVMQTRIAQHVEHYYAPVDVWVDVHILPTDEGVALYYRDLTDRKRAETLRDSAVRQLEQIFDASPDSIVCINRNWICTFANRAALDILKTDTLIGENLWERFPSNQKEPFRSHYRTTMDRRIATEFEAYYPEPLDIWFRVSARPFEDGIIIFSSDITDRKGAELLRNAAARQLRQVLETTTDAVVSLNHHWNFTFLNRQARQLLSPWASSWVRICGRNFPLRPTQRATPVITSIEPWITAFPASSRPFIRNHSTSGSRFNADLTATAWSSSFATLRLVINPIKSSSGSRIFSPPSSRPLEPRPGT